MFIEKQINWREEEDDLADYREKKSRERRREGKGKFEFVYYVFHLHSCDQQWLFIGAYNSYIHHIIPPTYFSVHIYLYHMYTLTSERVAKILVFWYLFFVFWKDINACCKLRGRGSPFLLFWGENESFCYENESAWVLDEWGKTGNIFFPPFLIASFFFFMVLLSLKPYHA